MSEKYRGVDIPDSITPFVGVRAWMVNKTLREEERLFSVFRTGVNWPIGRRLEAQCIKPSSVWAGVRGGLMHIPAVSGEDPIKKLPLHNAPYGDCTCGIYALNSYLGEGEVKPWAADSLRGIVLMWGHVVEGERGWRSQYAKVIALHIDSDEPSRVHQIERMAKTYKVPTVTDLEGEVERQRKLQGGMV